MPSPSASRSRRRIGIQAPSPGWALQTSRGLASPPPRLAGRERRGGGGGGEPFLADVADLIGQGDVTVSLERQAEDGSFVPAGGFAAAHSPRVIEGQSRPPVPPLLPAENPAAWSARPGRPTPDVQVHVTISDPFTFRDRSIQTVRGLLVLVGSLVFALAGLFSLWLARRLTTPVTRLTRAARAMAEGDLNQHVPIDPSWPRELVDLSEQFNTMAERLQQCLRPGPEDRARSRDFLADVGPELRTPIAALRPSNEL